MPSEQEAVWLAGFNEVRVVCDAAILNATVKQNLGSDRKLAEYLGISKGTAREYRLGHSSLPKCVFEKLQTLNPELRPLKITDAFWGQRKGGRVLWISSRSHRRAHRSHRLCSKKVNDKARRDRPLVPDEIGLYDVVAPLSILEVALREHKSALTEFVGRILGDGSSIIAPTYSASEIESQKRMQSLVLELFDYTPEVKIAKGNYRLQLRRICGHTLRLLGIPFGRKSVTNPDIPKFIMESHDPTVWVSFLRGIFDDEAYVSDRGVEIGLAVRQIGLHSIINNPAGSRVLDQVSELLCRLGIPHVRRKGQTYRVGETQAICWFLRIPRREFRKVNDLGLILLPQKRRKLIAAL